MRFYKEVSVKMDVKVDLERVLAVCHGCLSADRKLSYITGHNKDLFIKLRDDAQQIEDDMQELLLCWECAAALNKMKHFQARIKTAQCRLVQYFHNFFDKKNILLTLSSLTKTKCEEKYNSTYNFIYEEVAEQKNNILQPKDLTEHTHTQKEEEKEILDEKETSELLQNIKIEDNDLIKEEFDNDNISIGNGNDNGFFEQDLKIEPGELLVTVKKKKRSNQSQSIKKYGIYATIRENEEWVHKKDKFLSGLHYLSESEIEDVLNRDRTRENRFMCTICNLGYKRNLDYLRHKSLQHHKSQFPTRCLICQLKLHSESELQQHWKEKHLTMVRCSICSEICRTRAEIMKHFNRTHTKIYNCKTCPVECRTLREFVKHYKNIHEKAICDYCNIKLCSKRRMEQHIKRHHLSSQCTLCNRTLKNYITFKQHMLSIHPKLVASSAPKELSYCVECDKQYESVFKYKKHLEQSAKHKPRKKVSIPCPECGKIFTKAIYMKNHYKLIHVGKSQYYCDLCDKYFANGYGVRKHIQYVHQKLSMPKNKICDICGRGFTTNRILINHRRTHTGERPFKCDYCPATFAQETARKSHQKTQHKNILCT